MLTSRVRAIPRLYTPLPHIAACENTGSRVLSKTCYVSFINISSTAWVLLSKRSDVSIYSCGIITTNDETNKLVYGITTKQTMFSQNKYVFHPWKKSLFTTTVNEKYKPENSRP